MAEESRIRQPGPHIILVGFMGAGKTTIGRLLAEQTCRSFADTDALIEARAGLSVAEIFEAYGEEGFREMETEVLRELLTEEKPCIIAVGGGLPVRKENQQLLKALGRVIYLRAEADTLAGRLAGCTDRPLLKGRRLKDRILELMEKREAIYCRVSDEIIATDGRKPEETVREVLEKSC